MLTKPLKYHAEGIIRLSRIVLDKFSKDILAQPSQAFIHSSAAFQAAADLDVATQLLAQLNNGIRAEDILRDLDKQLRTVASTMATGSSSVADTYSRCKASALAQMSRDAQEILAYS